MRGAANLTPGGKPHQRHVRRFKIDRLPPQAKTLVFDGFARGDTFRKIAADLIKVGHPVGHSSISRYWREVWSAAHDRLRFARAGVAALKQALQLDPKSPSGQLAEEMLYTIVFQKLEEIEKQKPLDLLHEAREQEKLKSPKRPVGRPANGSPPQDARNLRRRWRQLYGIDEEAENDKTGE